MSDDDFRQFEVPLPPSHGWRCKPGNELFVADRGAAAFEIPEGWTLKPGEKGSLTLHNKPPPADEARLALTIFRLPPVKGGWSQIPLERMMLEADKAYPSKRKKHEKPRPRSAIHHENRPDVEIIWADRGVVPDPQNGRLIHTRQLVARARLVQVLMTFDVYQDVAAQFEPAWKELLHSLQLAVPRDITGQIGN